MKPPSFEQTYDRVDAKTVRSLQAFRRDHPLQRAQVEGVAWPYLTLGQGDEAILFLHGMAGAYDIWWQQIEALQGNYRTLSVTYPAVDNLAAMSRGLAAILDQEQVQQVNLVGSSLGGYLAQHLVATHPDRVQRAVFANTFPPNEILAKRFRLVAILLPFLPRRLIMRVLKRSAERGIYQAAGKSELVSAFLLEQAHAKMSKAQFVTRYQCVVDPFQPPDPQALGIPTLLVEADNDPLVEKTLRDMLKTAYPSAAVRTLHNVGHFAYLNEPEAYTQMLRQFLIDQVQQ